MRDKAPRIFSQNPNQNQNQSLLTLRREAAHVVKLTFLPENEGLGPELVYLGVANLSMKPKASS
jgi:hypothetical protein